MVFPSFRQLLWRGSVLVVTLGVLMSSTTPALAFLPKPPKLPKPPTLEMPNANGFASDAEQRYHINPDAIQDQGETLNVSDNKKGTPQVSLFFSPSDPQEGQKITAQAFPIYFSSESSDMYFTWYLQRVGCERNNNPSAAVRANCDRNNDNRITVEDWKVEAGRIVAGNGYDFNFANYGSDTDNDGYQARFGGDSRVNVPNHCYYHDNTSGKNYEIVENVGKSSFACNPGLEPVCMEALTSIDPGDIAASATGGSGTGGTGTGGDGGGSGTGGAGGTGSGGTSGGGSSNVTGETFESSAYAATVNGFPYCGFGGTVACITGTPCCVASPTTATGCTQDISGTVCTVSTSGSSNPVCKHLFPNAPGYASGDGTFGGDEEEFWQTDPNDPNTSDNGNKDEANVVGLGQESFTWNYSRGDKVGVVVEGLSMMPTKHNDSSNAIMWGFSKNNCKLKGATGEYQKDIRGYKVEIPTTDMNLNDCLEDNLVDPLEGGQATNLEIALAATPDDPLNDSSGSNGGDSITVTATIDNAAQELQNTFFDWKVDISPDGTSNPSANWETDIAAKLNNFSDGRKLVSRNKGNGLNSLNLLLNLKDTDVITRPFSSYLVGGVGYLRFRVDAAENFNTTGVNRRGKSDIIVRFTSTSDRIAAYKVSVAGDPAKLDIGSGLSDEICSGTVNPADSTERQILTRLDAKLCRVVKNEIIGLRVIGNGLTAFNWTINDMPLVCNTFVSARCANDRQGDTNFFPVIGNVGDIFTITVSAVNQNTSSVPTGSRPIVGAKAVTLSRAFKIVEPSIAIESADTNQAWPKVLGRYIDTSGGAYTDYSKTTLQAFSGSRVKLKAAFTPDFLGSFTPPNVERSWAVDGEGVGDGTSNEIAFDTLKEPGSIYNVTLGAVYRPNVQVRKALSDIWKISALDMTEVYFKTETQLEHPEQLDIGKAGTNKYLALLSSYLPAPLFFSIKVFLSVGLIIFITSFLFSIIPEAPGRVGAWRRRGE